MVISPLPIIIFILMYPQCRIFYQFLAIALVISVLSIIINSLAKTRC